MFVIQIPTVLETSEIPDILVAAYNCTFSAANFSQLRQCRSIKQCRSLKRCRFKIQHYFSSDNSPRLKKCTCLRNNSDNLYKLDCSYFKEFKSFHFWTNSNNKFYFKGHLDQKLSAFVFPLTTPLSSDWKFDWSRSKQREKKALSTSSLIRPSYTIRTTIFKKVFRPGKFPKTATIAALASSG